MNIKTETMGSITGNVASELNNGRSSARLVVFVALALWLGLVSFLASQGAFVGSANSRPLPIFFGVTIPLAVLFAASRRFVIWNILGIADFVVAVSMATLSSGAFPGITALMGNVTTSPMTRLPLVLIPAFMVPFFTMLHLTALFQARRLARSEKSISLR